MWWYFSTTAVLPPVHPYHLLTGATACWEENSPVAREGGVGKSWSSWHIPFWMSQNTVFMLTLLLTAIILPIYSNLLSPLEGLIHENPLPLGKAINSTVSHAARIGFPLWRGLGVPKRHTGFSLKTWDCEVWHVFSVYVFLSGLQSMLLPLVLPYAGDAATWMLKILGKYSSVCWYGKGWMWSLPVLKEGSVYSTLNRVLEI